MAYQTSRPLDPAELESDRKIREAKAHLTDRLDELKERVTDFRENFEPRQLLHNPWVHIGGAFVLGFLLGRTRTARPLFGALFTAAATAAMREMVSRQLARE
jgi:hypothetical protein